MYFEESRSETTKKNPLQLIVALAAALCVNGVMAAAILHSGIDDRLAHERSQSSTQVADLGTLPTIEVRACRVAA